ncbi:MAG: B3/4 domain-containing protein [Herpetosiphon sp.]
MRFTIETPFWELFPHALIGVVIVRGLNNSGPGAAAAARLTQAANDARRRIGDTPIPTHPAIVPWRAAYQAFGVKPAKYRSSIESLVRSALSERLHSINPLVDLYNVISLTHVLPCGGEDLHTVMGDIRLTRAIGNEEFVPLGSAVSEPPQAGEVIYRDDRGVLCRCWNWREADRTKLTATTTDAFLCIEALPPADETTLRQACNDLATLVTQTLGGHARINILTSSVPSFVDEATPVKRP